MSEQIIVFSADWCGPCKMYKPALQSFVDEGDRDIDVLIFDVDKDKEMVKKYNVRGVPTSIYISKEGKDTTKVGAMSRSQIEAWVANAA